MIHHHSYLNFAINLAVYESRLRAAIGSDLTALKITTEGLSIHKTGSYLLKQGITISAINTFPIEEIKQREINKCYKSIISSLQDYFDGLISVLYLKKDSSISLPIPATSRYALTLLERKLKENLVKVSTDRRLNIPKKLNILLQKPEHQPYKDSLQSYFDIRNGIEHHKSIIKSERIVSYKRMAIFSSAGYEVENPQLIPPEENCIVKSVEEKIYYNKGGEIILSNDQLISIVLNLLICIVPLIQVEVSEKLK